MPPSGVDQHVYVSVVAVREMATKIGWHPPETVGGIEAQLESYKHRVAALEDEVAQLNQEFEAIDLLESAGYTARKKPGRKAQPKEPLS
jgi:cell division protein FtsB